LCSSADGRAVTRGEERLSYRAIFRDVRQAVDWAHIYVRNASIC